MGNDEKLAPGAPSHSHRILRQILRPGLLVSAAVAAVLVSVPAIEPASAEFMPGGFHPRLGASGIGGQPQSFSHPAMFGHNILGHDPALPGRGRGRTGKGDPGNGRVVVGTGGDHPVGGGDNPRPPRWPIWKHPPHWFPPGPIVPVNPGVAVIQPGPNIGNPLPPGGGPAVRPVRRTGGVPPANERRYVPDEVVVEVATSRPMRWGGGTGSLCFNQCPSSSAERRFSAGGSPTAARSRWWCARLRPTPACCRRNQPDRRGAAGAGPERRRPVAIYPGQDAPAPSP
jgi:hypothetical protein